MHSRASRRIAFTTPIWRYTSIFLLIASVALSVGCQSSTTSAVTTGPTPAKCQLTLAPPPNIVASGGTGVIAVTAQPECAWTVSTQANWISKVEPASGQGDGKVAFVADENTVPTMRQGDIVINDNHVRVMQEAAPCQFAIDPERRTLSADTGTSSFTVAAHEACKWAARSTASWITVTAGADGAGNGTVTYRVGSNGNDPRSGTVTIGDRTHTIVQQGRATAPAPPAPPTPPNCTYAINPTSTNTGAGGGSGQVNVTATATCTWTAVSNNAWLTVTSGATGTGNGSVGFSAAANNTGGTRTGTITIAGRTFTVNQSAPAPEPCSWDINPSGASFSALGGTGSIVVSAQSGCAWTASNTASWISFTSGSGGSGNGRVDFLILPNVGSARSGTIAIAGHSFTVSQDGILPSQRVAP